MKVSLNWLKEWVSIDQSPEEIAHTLTMGGLEVDEFGSLGEGLEGIVVAKIESAEPHPDADRLRLCQVSGDSEIRQIVCGAPNARAGLIAPLATIGTVMPNGMKIKPAKLRGVASEGMLCSASELGLGEGAEASAGLMELPSDATIGQPLIEMLGLDDVVFDIDLTPNRADCLSIRGIARDLAALADVPFHPPSFSVTEPNIDRQVSAHVEEIEDCPVYMTRVIEGIDVGAQTPLWMSERLRRCGVRPIAPVVDVTNYVLLELGQPMHAFDAERLSGDINVRKARSGEKLRLLDGQVIDLESDCLVIADQKEPLALAGVMGGEDSSVTETTKTIVLESAWFNPACIAGKARRFGLATESAHRFERGVDPSLQLQAIERATELICQITGGDVGPVWTFSHEKVPLNQPIHLTVAEVNALLGTALSESEITEKLLALGMEVDTVQSDVLSVVAPNARRDMTQSVDLIEEVARLVGYDHLPSHPPSGELTLTAPSETEVPEAVFRADLIARGFQEVLGWSFIPRETNNPDGSVIGGVELANPLSQDQALMRPTLLPGLVSILTRNLRFGAGNQRLFEIGHCFGINSEHPHLGLAMMGGRYDSHFDQTNALVDFYDLKGEIEALFAAKQMKELRFVTGADHAWLHPAQSATIELNGHVVGYLGQLHPSLARQHDLKKGVMLAELTLDRCQIRALPKYQALSKYPASRRDLALLLPDEIEAGQVMEVIYSSGGHLLEESIIFDLYRGDGVEKGFKSLGIGLIIRDNSRTLTDQDVDAVADAVMASLAQTFGAKLRG